MKRKISNFMNYFKIKNYNQESRDHILKIINFRG